jgi:hypothetical protein
MPSPRSRRASSRRCSPVRAVVSLVALAAAASLSCGDVNEVKTCPGGTVPDSSPTYTVEFSVTNVTSPVGALQFETSVPCTNTVFLGRGDQVDCTSRVDGILAANYLGPDTLKVGMISLEGVRTPSPILDCEVRSLEPPVAGDFHVTVTDASDSSSEPLAPAPSVQITHITAH